ALPAKRNVMCAAGQTISHAKSRGRTGISPPGGETAGREMISPELQEAYASVGAQRASGACSKSGRHGYKLKRFASKVEAGKSALPEWRLLTLRGGTSVAALRSPVPDLVCGCRLASARALEPPRPPLHLVRSS